MKILFNPVYCGVGGSEKVGAKISENLLNKLHRSPEIISILDYERQRAIADEFACYECVICVLNVQCSPVYNI